MSSVEEIIANEVRLYPIIYDKRLRKDPSYSILSHHAFEAIVTKIHEKRGVMIPVETVKKIWNYCLAEARAFFNNKSTHSEAGGSKTTNNSSLMNTMAFMKEHLAHRPSIVSSAIPTKSDKKNAAKKRTSTLVPPMDSFAAKKQKDSEDILQNFKSMKDVFIKNQDLLNTATTTPRSNYFTVIFDLMKRVDAAKIDSCFDLALQELDAIEDDNNTM